MNCRPGRPRRLTASSSRGVRCRFSQTKLLPEPSFCATSFSSRSGSTLTSACAAALASPICFGSANSDGVSSVVASRTPLRSTMSARALTMCAGSCRAIRASPPPIPTSTRRAPITSKGEAEQRRGDEEPRVAVIERLPRRAFGRHGGPARIGPEMARTARIFFARQRLVHRAALVLRSADGAASAAEAIAGSGTRSGMASMLPSCFVPIGTRSR